ncbi:MAG: glutamate 5-kinase [Candidatus Omnitrophica bacterium]|nr:glutamate 5-kinase [Candidatus Omnitrophota bacterium]
MRQSARNYKRIVIKIGSSLFYSSKNELDANLVNEITGQISQLVREKKEVILVTSGAIALGMSILKLGERPKELATLQAAAAIGQHELMDIYRRFFKGRQLNCGQVLLTWEDFSSRNRYLNAKNTLLKLLELNSIPVINENDTVSTDEIRFGDNDRLSALVATLVNADLLIMLSDVDGLLDQDMSLIRVVDAITPAIKSLACPTKRKTSVGGMITKIEAAKIAVDSGISCVIANGRTDGVILSVVNDDQPTGTLFVSKKGLTAKARWIAFGTKTKGKIFVDDGAKAALLNKKSLLCVGVTDLEGNFVDGDVVSVRDRANVEFARGKVNVSAKVLEKVKGTRFDKEIIHRDNIVIL